MGGCRLWCCKIALQSLQGLQCSHQTWPAATVRRASKAWQKPAASRGVAPANKIKKGGGAQMVARPACFFLMSHFYSSRGASELAPEGWGGGGANLYAWSVGCINSRPAARPGRCGGFINTGTFPLLCISISHLSERFGNQNRQWVLEPLVVGALVWWEGREMSPRLCGGGEKRGVVCVCVGGVKCCQVTYNFW